MLFELIDLTSALQPSFRQLTVELDRLSQPASALVAPPFRSEATISLEEQKVSCSILGMQHSRVLPAHCQVSAYVRHEVQYDVRFIFKMFKLMLRNKSFSVNYHNGILPLETSQPFLQQVNEQNPHPTYYV